MEEKKCSCDKNIASVPYFSHEADMDRLERTNKRLWVIVIILIVALLGTNAGWIWYESQFITEETTITQENEDGINNFIGNDGDIYNGETDNNS